MFITAAAMAIALLQGGAVKDYTDYEVNNLRPSKIVARAAELRAYNIALCANDIDSKIRVTGPESARQEMINWIKLFDVKPLTIDLRVQVVSKIDKVRYDLNLSVPNMETFEFTETASGCRVSLTPRANADGTVTIVEAFKVNGNNIETVVRCKQGEKVTLYNMSNTPAVVPEAQREPLSTLTVSPRVRAERLSKK